MERTYTDLLFPPYVIQSHLRWKKHQVPRLCKSPTLICGDRVMFDLSSFTNRDTWLLHLLCHGTMGAKLFMKSLLFSCIYTVLQMFRQFCLFMMFRMAGMREVTPTSISIFAFYGINTLRFKFGNDIFTGNKMPTL